MSSLLVQDMPIELLPAKINFQMCNPSFRIILTLQTPETAGSCHQSEHLDRLLVQEPIMNSFPLRPAEMLVFDETTITLFRQEMN